MRILYAIQGTGNGHLSRARDVVPCLQKHGQVDLLVSGTQADITLPWPITYRFHGLSFVFGKTGGIAYGATLRQLRLGQLIQAIFQLPIDAYDLIITDFEPISAWAGRLRGKKVFGLSHQAAFLSEKCPLPSSYKKGFAYFLLRNYAPVHAYQGFHFAAYDPTIETPVIRSAVRALQCSESRVVVVYLPAFSDEVLLPYFEKITAYQWLVFSKHSRKAYQHHHIRVQPISNDAYLDALASCAALLTGGGFEAPAEALFLGKRIMTIPMNGQFEQQANAYAAQAFGAHLSAGPGPEFVRELEAWLAAPPPQALDYPNATQNIVDRCIEKWKALK
jgi:uncharacterized protein (TIGR00661 family)